MKKRKGLFFNYIRDNIEWKKEWKDMPEFIQNDEEPFKTLLVHFKNKEDIKSFAQLINQRISFKTKSIWYPEIKRKELINLRYVDEK